MEKHKRKKSTAVPTPKSNGDKRGYTITKKTVNIALHMGKEIKSVIKMKGYRINYVFNNMGIQRQTLYNILNTKLQTSENLILLSRTLDFDFFEYFSNKLFGSKDRVIEMYDNREKLYKQKIDLLEQKISFLEAQLLAMQKNKGVTI